MESIWIECKKLCVGMSILIMVFTGAYWLLQLEDMKSKYHNPCFEIYVRK